MAAFDLIIVGAGAAGLTAALEVARAGLKVAVIEARDRIGGRMFTTRDPHHDAPVEFGAEFIHGFPPEIWQPLQKHNIPITEVDGENWCVQDTDLRRCDFFSEVDGILEKMDDRAADESFCEFVERTIPGEREKNAKEWASSYVSGFNAADPNLVSVHWLVKEQRAEHQIEGDRAFRSKNGYHDLIEIFQKQVNELAIPVKLNTVVERITWKPGHVEISARDHSGDVKFIAPRALITLPLGVLQSEQSGKGFVQFDPQLSPKKKEALGKLVMGEVTRITLVFQRRFWENIRQQSQQKKGNHTLAKMAFLFSHDDWFPTWWTRMPDELPMITGWAPFRSAERFSGKSENFVKEKALSSLARLLSVPQSGSSEQLQAAYVHDWQSDPFSRGAYSYVSVGGEGSQAVLGAPEMDTLFFAGEATDISGNNGTVHGAIASGRRASAEILRSNLSS